MRPSVLVIFFFMLFTSYLTNGHLKYNMHFLLITYSIIIDICEHFIFLISSIINIAQQVFFLNTAWLNESISSVVISFSSLKYILKKVGDMRQALYDKVLITLFENNVMKTGLIWYHTFLFYFRIGSLTVGSYIEQYISLNMLALILSIITSRLHVAGYMIAVCLMFIRLDFSVVAMLRFYKKYPSIFHNNFPEVLSGKRTMWSQAGRHVLEAASNPQVQGVAVAVVGALAWKTLDVYDTQTQKEVAEADRLAEDARHKESLEAAEKQHKDSLEAAEKQHKDSLEAAEKQHKESLEATEKQHKEALIAETERQKDAQIQENRRIAFEKLASPEFNALSEEQQALIKDVVITGTFK